MFIYLFIDKWNTEQQGSSWAVDLSPGSRFLRVQCHTSVGLQQPGISNILHLHLKSFSTTHICQFPTSPLGIHLLFQRCSAGGALLTQGQISIMVIWGKKLSLAECSGLWWSQLQSRGKASWSRSEQAWSNPDLGREKAKGSTHHLNRARSAAGQGGILWVGSQNIFLLCCQIQFVFLLFSLFESGPAAAEKDPEERLFFEPPECPYEEHCEYDDW